MGVNAAASASDTGPKVELLLSFYTIIESNNQYMITKVTILTLALTSPTLPDGKTISFDLSDPTIKAGLVKNPVTIKEGVEYSYVSSFEDPSQKPLNLISLVFSIANAKLDSNLNLTPYRKVLVRLSRLPILPQVFGTFKL